MKIKLVESAQPISKLENNIERNILPEFAKYGFNFNTSPLEVSDYIYNYRGNSKEDFVSLRLNTASKEIDVWNETNSDEYVGDLFAELTLNGNSIDLGVISSRDPESVDAAMVEFNRGDYALPTKEDLESRKLIPPKSPDGKYKSMTKDEWIKEYKRLQDETDEIRDKITAMKDEVLKEVRASEEYKKLQEDLIKAEKEHKDTYWQEQKINELEEKVVNEKLGNNDEYNSLQDELAQKANYVNNTFYKNIYPFNEIN